MVAPAGLGLRQHDTLRGTSGHAVFDTWLGLARERFMSVTPGGHVEWMALYYDPLIDYVHRAGPTTGLSVALYVLPQDPALASVLYRTAVERIGWNDPARPVRTLPDPRFLCLGLVLARELGDDVTLARLSTFAEVNFEPAFFGDDAGDFGRGARRLVAAAPAAESRLPARPVTRQRGVMSITSALRLRPLTLADEAEARAAHAEMPDWDFLLHFSDADSWAGYVSLLDARSRGEQLTGRLVPSTFLVAEVDGTIVGRVSIRHELNAFLARWGGHVGYGVRPAFRRRGYATEMLRQALLFARAAGVERALVTCDDDNAGSARVIENCGGVLENVVPGNEDGDSPKRRYWIDPVRPTINVL